MYSNFGIILKEILMEKGISAYKLSKISVISKSTICNIINGKYNPTQYVLNELSAILKVDLTEYYKISRDFKSLNECKKYTLLRVLIEEHNIDQLEKEINLIDIEKEKEGIYKELLYYSKALIYSLQYKKFEKSSKYLLLALNLKNKIFNINNLEKYIVSDISYAVLSLMEYNYFSLNKKEEAVKTSIVVLNIIENNYINKDINITIPRIVFRTYIAVTNNLSDILCTNKEYKKAIKYCEKAVKVSNKYNSIYGLKYLYELMMVSNYNLGKLGEAKIYYDKVFAVLLINSDLKFYERFNKEIKENYTELLHEKMYLKVKEKEEHMNANRIKGNQQQR